MDIADCLIMQHNLKPSKIVGEHMQKLKNAAILFDLDGTLMDTAPDLAASMNFVLQQNGRREVPAEDVRNMVGRGARVLIERGMAVTGEPATEPELDQLFDQFLDYYLDHIADHSVVFPAVEDTLKKLKDAGAILAVCTNKPEGASIKLLKEFDLDGYFSAIVGGDSLPMRKPEPGHILGTIEKMGGVATAAVMVGDSANDIDAAIAAGIPVIGVPFGYTPIPIHDLGANVVVDHFDDMIEALVELL